MSDPIRNFTNNFIFTGFTLMKLPSLWFWGVRVLACDEKVCQTGIKYSWFTKNPFKSIYFSALFGTAELATGLLVQRKALQKGSISMLVVRSEAEFFKKAVGKIVFTCIEGDQVTEVFERLQQSGDQTILVLHSEGRDESGQIIGKFSFTWSLKKR